jgi:hypothetical protein
MATLRAMAQPHGRQTTPRPANPRSVPDLRGQGGNKKQTASPTTTLTARTLSWAEGVAFR